VNINLRNHWLAFFRPKLNLLVIAAVLIVFSAIDTWVVPPVVANEVPATANYRTVARYSTLRVFINAINRDPAPKVIMVGDSIIEGGGVNNANETIAHYLQSNLTQTGSPYHVYNLGIEGAGPEDSYYEIRALHLSPADVVVFDMNTGHYGNAPATFPDIMPMLPAYGGNAPSNVLPNNANKTIEQKLTAFIIAHWKLFALRDLVKEAIKHTITHSEPPQSVKHVADPPPWYHEDWTAKTKGIAKRGDNVFSNSDASLQYTNEMIQEVQKTSARMLLFNIPLNQQMMQQYSMLNAAHYQVDVDRLKTTFTRLGATYVNYETLVPSQYFVDSVHPTKEGNQIIANRLAADLSGLIKERIK